MNALHNDSALWDSSAVRVGIYFSVAFLTTFLTQTEGVTAFDDWGLLPWLRVLLASLISGLVAVRAFLDQSISRIDPKPVLPNP